jgi:DNA-binding MarR family transcriptional regulator
VTRDESTRAASLLRALTRRELAAYRQRGAVARQLGVSDDELLVLLHLAEHDGAGQGELCLLVGLSRSGMSTMVQRLERAGLVERRANPADRRVRNVVLTDDARERLTSEHAALVNGVERVLAQFSPEEQHAFQRFLDELTLASESAIPELLGAAPAARSDPIWRSWG